MASLDCRLDLVISFCQTEQVKFWNTASKVRQYKSVTSVLFTTLFSSSLLHTDEGRCRVGRGPCGKELRVGFGQGCVRN